MNDVTELAVRLSSVENELERLVRAYDGENHLSPGVIGILRRHSDRLEVLDRRIDELEAFLDKVRWTVAGAASVGSLAGGGVVFILTNFLGVGA